VRSNRSFSTDRIITVARRLLDDSTLCAISTVSTQGRVHVNTAYFAWNREFDLMWLSDPGATHSRNLRKKPGAAIAVYDSNQSWDGPDRGIQLFGSAREAVGAIGREAERVYAGRFPAYVRGDLSEYGFYRFRPRRMKLFDEITLGAGVFVTARVRKTGQVVWERTDVYRPGA
jgi:uncharacterized protein YhbP (UPF0306 family)